MSDGNTTLMKALGRGIGFSIVMAGLAVILPDVAPVYAQTPQPIFRDVTIGRNFSPDPLEVQGISGGDLPAKQIAGRSETVTGPCTGFIGEKPGHVIKLTSNFNNLKVTVNSPQDTTLVVSGPGGTWCNDDQNGKNPGIVGEWLAGEYKIWVGSFKKKQYLPYTITITEK